jgi:hypothetical protein
MYFFHRNIHPPGGLPCETFGFSQGRACTGSAHLKAKKFRGLSSLGGAFAEDKFSQDRTRPPVANILFAPSGSSFSLIRHPWRITLRNLSVSSRKSLRRLGSSRSEKVSSSASTGWTRTGLALRSQTSCLLPPGRLFR